MAHLPVSLWWSIGRELVFIGLLYPPHNEVVWGYIGFTPAVWPAGRPCVWPSVRPSVRLSVRPASRVRSVASTVQDGFFPYLVQMINSMRGCVANDDPWPWLISSRSFGLDLENSVRSVASTVLDGFFPYLVQMITSMRKCRMWWFLTLTFIFKVIGPWLWKSCPLCKVFSSRSIISIFATYNHYHWKVCPMFSL